MSTHKDKKNLIWAFLSHADKDKKLAGDIRAALKDFQINVFVAHDDIDGGEEWMDMLLEEIRNCDVFLILLTPDYHLANFTEQEAGAAEIQKKPILPISLNGATGYGFVTRYQNFKFDEVNYHYSYNLASSIYKKAGRNNKEIIDHMINAFSKVGSYDQANNLAKLLKAYDEFTGEQLEKIARAFLSNFEIQGGFSAKKVVRGLLKDDLDKLSQETRRSIEDEIEFD